MEENTWTTELISPDGVFNVEGTKNFWSKSQLLNLGCSYTTIAIMGPQSSGKSTLLNELFHTNFKVMDATTGRSKTTRGIWTAKSSIGEIPTIVFDLEGTDGKERSEDDDTAFEKQSALFALAIANVLIVNMWCHDIGRDQAANRPLLKTIFQVMMRIFSPRKITLLFVLRDKTKTPLSCLEALVVEDLRKMWGGIPKSQAYENTCLSELFNVEVVVMSNYETDEEHFKEEIALLREKLFHLLSPGGLGDAMAALPASAFDCNAQETWKSIQENKDLNLPAHNVLVANIRCEEIANDKFSSLGLDEAWLELKKTVEVGPVLQFGKSLGSILTDLLSKYDKEVTYFDEGVRNEKRQQMLSKALNLVKPAYDMMLQHLHSKALEDVKNAMKESLRRGENPDACVGSCILEFDKGCKDSTVEFANWDASEMQNKLYRDIEAHISSIFEKQIADSLVETVKLQLESGAEQAWHSIRRLLRREMQITVSECLASMASLKLDQAAIDKREKHLVKFAKDVVREEAKQKAGIVLKIMIEKFVTEFYHDDNSMPRVWTENEDIKEIAKNARSVCLQLLSNMAAIRLDHKPDVIKNLLFSSLMDRTNNVQSSQGRNEEASSNLLALRKWENVPPEDTLITPMQCESLWKEFLQRTEFIVTQALLTPMCGHRQCNNKGDGQRNYRWQMALQITKVVVAIAVPAIMAAIGATT